MKLLHLRHRSPECSGYNPIPAAGRHQITMIEVLLAILLLTIMAIAGGAYITHGGADVRIENHRRIATELGSSRLEQILVADYVQIEPPENMSVYYYSIEDGQWQRHSSDPEEILAANGFEYPIVTTMQYKDRDGGFPTYDYLEIKVKVGYRNDMNNYVELQTQRSRWE